MLKIANIEMDLKGNSLGYYLLTGERKTVDELLVAQQRPVISDAINDWIPAKPNLTAEQKAELKLKFNLSRNNVSKLNKQSKTALAVANKNYKYKRS